MFESEDDEPEPTDDHLDELVGGAVGSSVAIDRLRGDEQYFPDCRPFLQEGQQPQHLILLTTTGWAFRAEGTEYDREHGTGSTHTSLSATSDHGGVAICTETELLIVVNDSFVEVPFANLRGILRTGKHVEIYWTGNKPLLLDVAKSADEREVDAAVDYLRRKIRAATAG